MIETVVHDRFGEDGHNHKGRMLGLLILRSPDQTAPALGQDVIRFAPDDTGIRDELDHGITLGRVIVFRDKQLILQAGAGFGVFIGVQLELGGHFSNHGLELDITGFVSAAAIAAAHAALSAAGAAIAAATAARAFSKSNADSTEKRKDKNH